MLATPVAFRPRYFPESKRYQLFLRDPNGVMIELNFFGIDDAAIQTLRDLNII